MCLPIASHDDWEEGTQNFQLIFESVGMVCLGLFALAGLLVLLGGGRY